MEPDLWTLVREVYTAGRTLEITPTGRIGVKPEPLPGHLRKRVTARKAEVMAALQQQSIGQRTWSASPSPRIYAVPAYCPLPEVCHRLGPCGPPGTLVSCDADHPTNRRRSES